MGEGRSTTCACDTGGFDPVSGFVFLDVDLNGSYGPGDHPILNRTARAGTGQFDHHHGGLDTASGSPVRRHLRTNASPGAAGVQGGTPYLVTVTEWCCVARPSVGHDGHRAPARPWDGAL